MATVNLLAFYHRLENFVAEWSSRTKVGKQHPLKLLGLLAQRQTPKKDQEGAFLECKKKAHSYISAVRKGGLDAAPYV